MGERAARRYFLTAEIFNADEAKHLGLLHEVVTDETALLEQGKQLTSALLLNSPQAITKTKQLIKEVSRGEINNQMRDYTVNLIASIRVSDEGQEGLASFLDKRQPNWQKN